MLSKYLLPLSLVCLLTAHCGESSPSDEAREAELLPPALAAMVGQFYLPADQAVDAHNLSINPDHTYRSLIEGCDVRGQTEGSWAEGEGGKLVLTSNLNKRPVYEVVSAGECAIEVRALGRVGDPERWERGSICAVCGNLGPLALEVCTNPAAANGPPACHSGS